MSPLFICATPIGNLEDITLRVLRILKEVDLIAAEDTRHTQKLLHHYQIKTPLTSYHKFNIRQKTPQLINQLAQGKAIALVSDAGMPGISDPGYELVKAAIEKNIQIIPLPGPSAAITALAISGLPTEQFTYVGFLPKKGKERQSTLAQLKDEPRTIILYESPHRILATLEELEKNLGDREVCVARELTKKFEETVWGKISKVRRQVKVKGEFVIVIKGQGGPRTPYGVKAHEVERGRKKMEDFIRQLKEVKVANKDITKLVTKNFGLKRNEAYKRVMEA